MARMSLDSAMTMAVQLHTGGRLAEAEGIYRQVLSLAPNHPDAIHNLGEIAFRVRRLDVALQLVDRAIRLAPSRAGFHNTRSVILLALGRPEDSWEACQKTLQLAPNLADGHVNIGILQVDKGDLPAGIASFKRAIELAPDNPNAHDGLGLSLLMSGQLHEGWVEQEWRWRKSDFGPRRRADSPHWQGEDLTGKTLLLMVEQGYGDVFQFCRYVPILAQRGARVLLESLPEINGLLSRICGLAGLVDPGVEPAPADWVCPLMSVPLLLGTTLETVPADIPYLIADPALVADWREVLGHTREFKIGIAWAGRPTHNNDLNRSTTAETFAPLLSVPGVKFFSLQKGPAAAALPQLPGVTDLSPRLTDFDQTAAALTALDMIISVDTAVVHLAGALGRPVWTLLPFCPDWRWMLHRTDTPWYPQMRLFRAPNRGNWPAVMREVESALRSLVANRK